MEVAYYQVFIFLSIFLVNLFKREWLLVVCGMWTAFTVLNLHYLPLIFIQLGVVWGSFILFKLSQSKDHKISELEDALSVLSKDQKKNADLVPAECKRLLQDQEHYDYLMESIRKATEQIVVLSGWITPFVIDKSFLDAVESKLSENVSFYLGYGYQDSHGKHNGLSGYDKVQNSLMALVKKYPQLIFIGEYANHEKVLVVDHEEVVYGSANWLSNRNYSNKERSVVLRDAGLASNEANRIKALIRNNLKTDNS